jgi:hypothetical protein
VSLTDVNAGGSSFSIANDQLVVGGQAMPLDSAAAQSFVDSVNEALTPTRCTIALGTDPRRYPQGFLLSRKEPRIGLADDGTYAASMRGGLIVFCDLPDELGTGTDFKPQRLQVALGFAYTAASAITEPGGFGIGDLGTGDTGAPAVTEVAGLQVAAPTATPALEAPAAAAAAPQAIQPVRAARRLAAPLGAFDMDPATRWLLALVSVVAWAALTHAGARRLRGALQ